MGKYFRSQCKRMLRFLPGALFASLVLMGGVLLAFQLFTQQNADREDDQKISIAICGETDHFLLQMGITTLTSYDPSRFAIDVLELEEPEAARTLARGDIPAYVVIPEGFMEAALRGEILPVKFYTAVGATGIVSLVKEELSKVVSDLLLRSQEGVFGMWDAMVDNGLQSKAGGQMDLLALRYVDHILMRDRIYTLDELGIADDLGLEDYLLCGLGVLFLLLICLPFAAQMIPGDPALGRMLCSKGRPAWQQALCDLLAYTATLFCLVLILILAAKLYLTNKVDLFALVPKTLPVLLFAAAFSFMLYSLSRDMISGVMLQFFVTAILCFVSGCLYPVYFFPVQIQQLAQWLPTGIARTQLASCITGTAPSWTVPALLSYCAVFAAIGTWARVRHIQEVER